jgi:HEAT repeat protein
MLRLGAFYPVLCLAVLLGVPACSGPSANSTDSLLEELHSDDPTVRLRAARQLHLRGTVPEEAVPDLLRALRDENPELRLAAARALEVLDARPPEVVPELLKVHARESDAVVRAAIEQAVLVLEKPVPDPWSVDENDKDFGMVEWEDEGPDAQP